MKVAPATSRNLIRYQNVAEIEERGPNKIFLIVRGKGIKLPVNVLEPSDVELVLAAVREGQSGGGLSRSEAVHDQSL